MGEYWVESVFYCLIFRNLGRCLKNKRKIEEKLGKLRKNGVLYHCRQKYWEIWWKTLKIGEMGNIEVKGCFIA